MRFCFHVILFIILFIRSAMSVETSGKDYRLSLEGEKTFHFEKRMADASPSGFYPGADRREELRLSINGDLYNKIKVTGEMENAGPGDAENVMWLSLSGKQADMTLGKFNASFSGTKLFLVNRRVDGGLFQGRTEKVEASAIISRPGGVPFFEKFVFSGRGAYSLGHSPILFESEVISVNNERLVRGRDYQLEYNTGRFFLTPRFLSDQAISDGGKGIVVKVSYESISGAQSGLEGARLVFKPLKGLGVGVVGIQERFTSADSNSMDVKKSRKLGVGSLLRLNYDSLILLNGEAGAQKETGKKNVFAKTVDGAFNYYGKATLNGEYSSYDNGYSMQGNSNVESGLEKACARGSLRPAKSINAEGEYSQGTYDNYGTETHEREVYSRLDMAPYDVLHLGFWGRNRELHPSDSTKEGNTFFHSEAGREFGKASVAIGGEYEQFYGRVGPSGILKRNPYFVKVASLRNNHLNFSSEINAEQTILEGDTGLGGHRKELRSGISGMLAANYTNLDMTLTGVYSGGNKGYMESAVEGRVKTSALNQKINAAGTIRDALERTTDSANGVTGVKERRTLVEGEFEVLPMSMLGLSYAPLVHFRRNVTMGRDIMSETRHHAGAKLLFKPVKWGVDAELYQQSLKEIVRSDRDSKSAGLTADILFPMEINTRARADIGLDNEEENSPITGDIRGKKSTQKSGELRNIIPIGKNGNFGLGGKWLVFKQNVVSTGVLNIDSSNPRIFECQARAGFVCFL